MKNVDSKLLLGLVTEKKEQLINELKVIVRKVK